MKYLCNKQKVLKKLKEDKERLEYLLDGTRKDSIEYVKSVYPDDDHKKDFLMELNDELRRMEFEARYLDNLIKFVEGL